MIERFVDLGVDAGVLSVADYSWYIDKGGSPDLNNLHQSIILPPGKYTMTVTVMNTWNGDINETFSINIPSGKLVIGDPCYGFKYENNKHDAWMDLLEGTDFLKDMKDNRVKIIETGGDGCFDMEINFH